jgi:Kef-type K+ transport system membrane component KefB
MWGLLTIIAFCLVLVLATIASFYVQRLRNRVPLPISEEIGSAFAVVKKLRKRQPLSEEELAYAKQIVADRSSPLAFCIPGTLFMLGGFYVLGSLYHLHGATPSERTFIGVIPMLTSANLALQLVRSAKLKKVLREAF